MGYLKSFGTAIIYIGFFLALITFLPGLPPEAEFSEYRISLPDEKQFTLKNRLHGAEVLFSGDLKGPEAFDSYNGEIYTGLHGGYVVKVEENRIVPIVKFGQKCDGIWQEHKCGRPLGLKFNHKGELFVADAYYGIFKVDITTRQYKNIVNSSEPIGGKTPKIVNSLDIAKNGDIYWTDSSTEFPLYDGTYTMLANPSGRLIRYNAATKKNEVLLNNLAFANGLKLSEDESFVIIAETMSFRIIKYHLKGPKAGQHEIFVESLPGCPDNIHADGDGGFLVTLILSVDSEHPLLAQSLIPHPYLRKMLARLLYLLEAPFKLMQDIYPNPYAERLMHSIGSFEGTIVLDLKKTSIVLRIDKTGKVLDALYSDDKKVYSVCSAHIHNDYLWLGSPFNEFILRVPLKQAFPDLYEKHAAETKREPRVTIREKRSVKTESNPNVQETTKPTAEQPKVQKPVASKPVTTTTPKPTTTTPKPTTQKPTPTAPKVTTTTPKPTTTTPKPTIAMPKPTPTTSKPPAKSAPKDTRTQTEPKTSATSPPPQKQTVNQDAKQQPKPSSNPTVNAKPNTAKTDSQNKVNKPVTNDKSGETSKKNVREKTPEKPSKGRTGEQNRPKDSTN